MLYFYLHKRDIFRFGGHWKKLMLQFGFANCAMIAALEHLKAEQGIPVELPGEMTAFGINGGLKNGLAGLLMSHPPLDERIAALRAGNYR